MKKHEKLFALIALVVLAELILLFVQASCGAQPQQARREERLKAELQTR